MRTSSTVRSHIQHTPYRNIPEWHSSTRVHQFVEHDEIRVHCGTRNTIHTSYLSFLLHWNAYTKLTCVHARLLVKRPNVYHHMCTSHLVSQLHDRGKAHQLHQMQTRYAHVHHESYAAWDQQFPFSASWNTYACLCTSYLIFQLQYYLQTVIVFAQEVRSERLCLSIYTLLMSSNHKHTQRENVPQQAKCKQTRGSSRMCTCYKPQTPTFLCIVQICTPRTIVCTLHVCWTSYSTSRWVLLTRLREHTETNDTEHKHAHICSMRSVHI